MILLTWDGKGKRRVVLESSSREATESSVGMALRSCLAHHAHQVS